MQLHSTQSFYDVHRLSGPTVARQSSRPARWLLALFRWIAEEHATHRAMRELQSFDDRMLRDIGVRRSEIERYVRYGRDTTRTVDA